MSGAVLLLGFVDRDAPQPPDVAPHRRLPFGGILDAVAIDLPRVGPGGHEVQAMDMAIAQVSILSAYAAENDVLPVALGAAFSGDASLLAHLAVLAPRLLAQREALAGCNEWVLAVDERPRPVAEPPAVETGYLRRRQAEIRDRRRLETARGEYLSTVARAFGAADVRVGRPECRPDATLATMVALVQRAAVETVRARLEELARDGERLGLALRLIGPCAPFSFIAVEDVDG